MLAIPGYDLQYCIKTEMCKFGAFCKYYHPRQGEGYPCLVTHNIHEFISENERKCSHYMRTGQCEYGMTCKFHHPLPANVQVSALVVRFFPFLTAEPFSLPVVVPPPTTYLARQSLSIHLNEQYRMVGQLTSCNTYFDFRLLSSWHICVKTRTRT
ncbi:hypothetical protein T459_28661 [Capsicum annuum]|uniref:C3H1-type domain-containing protein n=1 Tax=Capsicum annuum TaxID=4072 RepID=A0A2G2YHE7_CAPAN|nr:putative zinc finger CCCH domain-containing protein 5-like [Capsicum annuum]PHT69174.1 hypothetical protein T459_28661 [Capsicum annuum]